MQGDRHRRARRVGQVDGGPGRWPPASASSTSTPGPCTARSPSRPCGAASTPTDADAGRPRWPATSSSRSTRRRGHRRRRRRHHRDPGPRGHPGVSIVAANPEVREPSWSPPAGVGRRARRRRASRAATSARWCSPTPTLKVYLDRHRPRCGPRGGPRRSPTSTTRPWPPTWPGATPSTRAASRRPLREADDAVRGRHHRPAASTRSSTRSLARCERPVADDEPRPDGRRRTSDRLSAATGARGLLRHRPGPRLRRGEAASRVRGRRGARTCPPTGAVHPGAGPPLQHRLRRWSPLVTTPTHALHGQGLASGSRSARRGSSPCSAASPCTRHRRPRGAAGAAARSSSGGEPLVMFPEGTRQAGPVVEDAVRRPGLRGVPDRRADRAGGHRRLARRSCPRAPRSCSPVKLVVIVGDPIPPPRERERGRVPAPSAVARAHRARSATSSRSSSTRPASAGSRRRVAAGSRRASVERRRRAAAGATARSSTAGTGWRGSPPPARGRQRRWRAEQARAGCGAAGSTRPRR